MRLTSSSSSCCQIGVTATVALLCTVNEVQSFVPSGSISRARQSASPFHASAGAHRRSGRGVRGSPLQMAVQTPPKPKKPEFDEDRVADEELLSVIELAGRKAAAAGFLPVLGAKAKEEQDVMWKLKVW